MPIRYNIHARAMNKGYLYTHLSHLPRGGSFVVMDELDVAVNIQNLTGGRVYHRRLQGIESDDDLQRKINPDDFMMFVGDVLAAGVGVYVNNEPGGSPETVGWLLEVARRMVAAGGHAVLGNLKFGTPEPEQLEMWRPLVEYIQQHPRQLTLGLHEGGLHHWTDGIDGIDFRNMREFSVQRWAGRMHYSGRFERFRTRFGFVPILITEWGFDNFKPKGVPVSDGAPIHEIAPIWRDRYQRPDLEHFAYEQLNQVMQAIYDPHNVDICLFCWGAAAPRWQKYDWSQLPRLHQLMEENQMPEEPRNLVAVKVLSQQRVNIRTRQTTESPIIGLVVPGDVLLMHWDDGPVVAPNDGHQWVYIEKNEQPGYIASEFVKVVPVEETVEELLFSLRAARESLDDAINIVEDSF